MTAEPIWIDASDARAFHAVLVAGFGGSDGLADAGLLESALARPRARYACASQDLCELAATYAHGIVRNHPFLDGNKRTAFTVARVFLAINGQDLQPPEEEVVVMTVALAAGDTDLSTYAAWLRKHCRRKKRLRGLGKQTKTRGRAPSRRRRK